MAKYTRKFIVNVNKKEGKKKKFGQVYSKIYSECKQEGRQKKEKKKRKAGMIVSNKGWRSVKP